MEWARFIANLRLVHLKKGEHLFREGEVSNVIGFVTRGLIYTYYNNDDGKIRVKNFAWEGRLISPYAAILEKKPANFSAEAIEPTLVLVLDGRRLEEWQERHVCWERLTRKCAEKIVIERERREFETLAMSYDQRIDSFFEQFAPIIDRIPQYLIAGYLGITPVALSRIRAKKKSETLSPSPNH